MPHTAGTPPKCVLSKVLLPSFISNLAPQAPCLPHHPSLLIMKSIPVFPTRLVLATFLLLPCGLSQRADFALPLNQQNRRFFWSDDSPIAEALNRVVPQVIPDIELILRHAERVENAVIDTLSLRRGVNPQDIVRPCSPLGDPGYLRSYNIFFGVVGLLRPVVNCSSEVSGVSMFRGEQPGYTLDDLYNAVFNRGLRIKQRVDEITNRVISNFTRPEMPFNFSYDTSSVQCRLSPACLARQDDKWYHFLGIHAHGKDDHVIDGAQQSVYEFLRVADGKLGDSLLMRLPVYSEDENESGTVIRDDTTTLIQSWSRSPPPSCFRLIPIEENLAIVKSLDAADHFAQQVEDALTPSNLAILILPLGLNLIPVSLFADVGTIATMAYTFLSDVLTIVPLGIKGVELIDIGRNRFRSVVTRVSSNIPGNTTKPRSVGGEIWAAECNVRDHVTRAGIAMLVTALVALVLGISAEILAKYYVKRRPLRREMDTKTSTSISDEGDAMLYLPARFSDDSYREFSS